MSGAEALAGVSLVCNVIQIVTFMRDVITTYKSIEDNHSLDPRLSQICEAVRAQYERLIEETRGNVDPLDEAQQALVQGAGKCVKRTQELDRMMSRLSVPANTSRPRKTIMAVTNSVSAVWKKNELAALEKDLERYQGLVDTHLLRHISRQTRSFEQQSLKSFAELDGRLKQVLKSYETKHSVIRAFMVAEADSIKACVTEVGMEMSIRLVATERVIRSDLDKLENTRLDERTKAEQEERQRRLLESLYFPERNARWNRIEENYPRTFEWVFSIPGESQSESTDGSSVVDDSDEYDSEDDGDEENGREHDRDDKSGSEDDRDYENNSDECGGEGDRSDESEASTVPNFAHWLRSDSKLFWISGKPASGKSTLMKYIITDQKTMKHLREWNPDVCIVHHFFWKPGVPMQNSVNGMLCSLLFQMLEHQPSLIESISEDGFDPAAKRSYHDWSTKELKSTLFRLLRVSGEHFCIFLDGLDEAAEQLHRFDIKSLLDGLVQLDNVKICASGRPEPKFAQYFTNTKQIAIHDLTRDDIKTLVKQRLEEMHIDPDFRWRLAWIVERRAQGVFMWVILVLNSVQMGIESETPEECLGRVSRMAQDLHALYRDMWSRATYHGIDRTIATLYFRLVVWRSIHLKYTFFNKATLLEMALMADEKGILAIFVGDSTILTEAELLEQAERTRKQILVGCAGLLECVPGSTFRVKSSSSRSRFTIDPGLDTLGECAETVVNFTHRTVFDFFTDSEYGQDILAKCPLTDEECFLRCLKSIMLACHYVPINTTGMLARQFPSLAIHSNTIVEIIRCISHYESRNLTTAETADKMVEVARKWQLQGHFRDPGWEMNPRWEFLLPNEPPKIRLLEFVEALVLYYPRMASRIISELEDSDFLDVLPVILFYRGSDYYYDGEGVELHARRYIHSRLSKLDALGETTRRGELGRVISVTLSHILRMIIMGTSLNCPQTWRPLSAHRLRSAVETIESITKLEVFDHWWGKRFMMVLSLDFEKDSFYLCRRQILWGKPSIVIACNDLFLKHLLGNLEGLQGLQALGQDTRFKPNLEVVLVRNGDTGIINERSPWHRPSVSDANKTEDLLFKALIGGQTFLSIKNQLEEVTSSVKYKAKIVPRKEFDSWQREVIAQLEELGHAQHPWMPLELF